MSNEEFSEDLFSSIIDMAMSSGYQFCTFSNNFSASKKIYLRHDVDISPSNALKLGRIAAEKGARSNIFFQLNADTYNIFCPTVISTIAQLKEMGHCVGLHIDQMLLGEDEAGISETLHWFSRRITPIDKVISFHRPTPNVLGRHYDAFVNSYDNAFFRADAYLSDSRRSLAFLAPLQTWLADGLPMIQLLLHPEWWSALGNVETVWAELRDRREGEIARYVRANFPKVFAHVVAVEDRDFRI